MYVICAEELCVGVACGVCVGVSCPCDYTMLKVSKKTFFQRGTIFKFDFQEKK